MKPLTAPTAHGVLIRTVYPNAGVRVWYAEQLQELLKQISESLILHIGAAWKKNTPDIGFATDDKSSTLMLKAALEKWGDVWIRKMEDMSTMLARRFADKSIRHSERSMLSAFAKSGFTIKFKPTQGSLEAYRTVLASNVGLIKSIPQQFLKDVQQSVWNSVLKGGDLSTLSRDIRQNYGVGYRRAALIARDQNAKAKALIENVRRKELGLTEAIWMHSGGGKVPRPTHVAMSGKRYKLKQGMFDSHEGKFVFPGELINCRCSSRAVVPGFDDD